MKVAWILVIALTAIAAADAHTERAAKLNDEGKELMFASKYEDARLKFMDAVAHDPLAIYLFNLCTADFQTGRFGEALTHCKAVATKHPPEALQQKTDKLIAKIRAEAAAQHVVVD